MAQAEASGNKRVVAIAIDDSEHAENALKCKFFCCFFLVLLFQLLVFIYGIVILRTLLITIRQCVLEKVHMSRS